MHSKHADPHPMKGHEEHAMAMTEPLENHPNGGGVGHDKHEGHDPAMFRDRLWVSLVLTLPILYLSDQIQSWFGYTATSFAGDSWVNPVLATALFVYAGSVFLKGGYRELKHRQPGMMTLISIAIAVAYGYSVAVSLGLEGNPFYWELATLLDVMLLGHWIEMRSIASASRALDHLAAMVPSKAHVVQADGSITDIDVADLRLGDHILVRPGEQVPVDAEIIEGSSSVNEAFLTGESRPVGKAVGDEIVAGSVNGEGSVTGVVMRIGDQTTLSQIMRLVADAQESRSRFQVLADRAAMWLTFVAIGSAVPTLIVWLLVGSNGATFAVARTVTVLVIACPHALGLAIPLVNMNATSISARNGILVRNREAFERGRSVDFVAFDKTGTLTEGRFAISGIATEGLSRSQALAIAAALERGSEHPLGQAIVEEAEADQLSIPGRSNVKAVPGYGIEGRVEGQSWRVGKPEWIGELGVTAGSELVSEIRTADARGESAIVLMTDQKAIAVFRLADRIRSSARTAIQKLLEMDIKPVMITGDADAVAKTVAEDLGVPLVHSRVLPEEKVRIIRGLKKQGAVAFVGDGINDAPALLEADLGVAIGAGTNVAIESADLVLVDNDPSDVVRAIQLSAATSRKMRQNLAWATGYNALAIPLAAGVASSAGILLNPAVGALLMSMSTVIVAINAMLLRRTALS